MIENSSRKHLGTDFLGDIESQQNFRKFVDDPTHNVNVPSKMKSPQIVVEDSSLLEKMNKKSSKKTFES